MVTALLYIPPRRLWAEVDTDEKGNSGNERRTKFKPPSNIPNSVQRQIGAQTEEDTESDPHLPTHNEATSDRSRDVFGGKNRDRGRFGTHTNSEQQTADEKLFPGLGKTRTDDREKTKDGAEEDSAATSEVEVKWIGKPATTTEKTSTTTSFTGDDM